MAKIGPYLLLVGFILNFFKLKSLKKGSPPPIIMYFISIYIYARLNRVKNKIFQSSRDKIYSFILTLNFTKYMIKKDIFENCKKSAKTFCFYVIL